jgi:hypothetical protein
MFDDLRERQSRGTTHQETEGRDYQLATIWAQAGK